MAAQLQAEAKKKMEVVNVLMFWLLSLSFRLGFTHESMSGWDGSCPKVSTCYKCIYLQADTLLGDELGADAGGKLGVEARWHACQKGL